MEDDEEDVSSYWMNLRKINDTVNWNTKHDMAHYGELALEESTDPSRDICIIIECILCNETRSIELSRSVRK